MKSHTSPINAEQLESEKPLDRARKKFDASVSKILFYKYMYGSIKLINGVLTSESLGIERDSEKEDISIINGKVEEAKDVQK